MKNIKSIFPKLKEIFTKSKKNTSNIGERFHFPIYPNFLCESNVDYTSYQKNVVVYRCVNIIAQAVSHVHLEVHTKNLQHKQNIANILKRPNFRQSGFEFFNELVCHKLLFGNAYVLQLGYSGYNQMSEIILLHPEHVEVVIEDDKLIGYKYRSTDEIYYTNPEIGKIELLHLKNYNPSDQLLGMSNLEPAKSAIDLHTKSTEWNNSLIKNGARPTGALVFNKANSYLTEEQFFRLKNQLDEMYSGSQNAGRPLLLEGGLEWQEMSINPKDMDFIESKNMAAREIALAFGVPPQLLGIKGDNTYNNMQEARIGLWEETIIPILDELCDSFSQWFSSIYNREIQISFNKDSISILSDKRHNLWKNLAAADFMTTNEKRALVGLPPIENQNPSNL